MAKSLNANVRCSMVFPWHCLRKTSISARAPNLAWVLVGYACGYMIRSPFSLATRMDVPKASLLPPRCAFSGTWCLTQSALLCLPTAD